MEYLKKQKGLKFSLLFFIGGCLTSCTPHLKDDQALVRVNDITIKVRDYRSAIEKLKPEENTWSRKDELQVRNILIKALVRRAALLSESKRKDITVSDAELESAASDYKSSYKAGVFDQALLDDKINPEDWLAKVKEDLLIKKLIFALGFKPTKPTLRDALLYYEKNSQLFKIPESINIQQIIVPDQKVANEVEAKLKISGSLFTDIAREYSSAWTEKNKDVVVIYKGAIPESVSPLVFSAATGRLMGPVEMAPNFLFFKVIRKNPSINKDFETVKPEIEKILAKQQEKQFLENLQDTLLRSASIDYNRKLISAL